MPYRESAGESEGSKHGEMMQFEVPIQESQNNAIMLAETENDIKSIGKLKFLQIYKFIFLRIARTLRRN